MRKHLKKTTKRAVMAAGIAGVAVAGSMAVGGMAYASTNHDNLADVIASKFKLNKAEVHKVIKDERHKDHAEHQQAHLAQLVKDGKLTQVQADKLKAKETEMEPKREAAQDETDATKRKAAHEAIRAEMDQWFKDNGIDRSVLRPPRGEGRHMGVMRMHDGPEDAAPSEQ